MSGDLEAGAATDPEHYDEALEAGVRRFQGRHGLKTDGLVGPKTRAALNVPAAYRAAQIRITLERWRPVADAKRRLVVNIPGFRLTLYERGEPRFSMRVIVGRPDEPWKTPSFASSVRYLVLNPSWTVPEAIARDELLPQLLADPGYLSREGIQAFQDGEPIVLTRDVAREAVAEDGPLPFLLRQAPGPRNALGRVKLVFPNRHLIYLHDTPRRHLFERRDRALSHGCVRLEWPLTLAAALLGPEWDRKRLLNAVADGKTRKIVLPAPVPIEFVYHTAWVGADGRVHFRDDVYGRNAKSIAALAAEASSLAANVN